MSDSLAQRAVSSFGLTPTQREAALERGRDVVVTAGAGSGKTRTLVARYATLLAEGLDPRRVVAITFTEKAAREMRSRVREALVNLVRTSESDEERRKWIELSGRMDSARIGTIHSLCAEILRTHPAEAGIDPRFDVLDEGLTSAVRVQVAEDTLARLVDDPQFTQLFTILGTRELESLLKFLIEHRLEATEAFANLKDPDAIVRQWIEKGLRCPAIADVITDLRRTPLEVLVEDKREHVVHDLLFIWKAAEDAFAAGNVAECAELLYQARREKMNLSKGKRESQIKEMIRSIQSAYDELLDPFIGGKDNSGFRPDREAEALLSALQPILPIVFAQLARNYAEALRQRQALDFDDLEAGAVMLLSREEIRARWQTDLDALLVDEFQDTNSRQREIVDALAGEGGRLFIVGDERQSIYRFRRADVTVFRSIKEDIKKRGGLAKDLDQTYRAHEPLLDVTGDLLKAVMGTGEDPTRSYYVPFASLVAHWKEAPEHYKAPHIELVLGVGEDATSARPVMARALARRLQELKDEQQIHSWDEVTLLFRASSGFPYYEDAFEEAGIPFVTVAGSGFYDRPEIRDVLNLLRALADPADDLAMAGLLRSPAFGLTDAVLYRLRKQGDSTVPYWSALQGVVTMLSPVDQERAQRAVSILNQLFPQVDRIPVAELLKQLVDETDYRAILAAGDEYGIGGRLWRNLDKLLADAQASGQVNVRDFLDYLATLSDAGAREGEAPAEAQGAVRLMTIHKAKGLEFPVVVLADAGRTPRNTSDRAYLLPEFGLACKLDPDSMFYRLVKWQDSLQSEAESLRILYVALTRAKEKLFISGHATPTSKGWKSEGWLEGIAAAAQVDLTELVDQEGIVITNTANGHPVRAFVLSTGENDLEQSLEIAAIPDEPSKSLPLYRSLTKPAPTSVNEDEPDERRPWRVTGSAARTPPGIIGQMVHKAIESWIFPGDHRLPLVLKVTALSAGLASLEQQAEATRRATGLLERLRAHPIWEEIDSAEERFLEIPYSRMVEERTETGFIDLLYCRSGKWKIVDFKTDFINGARERERLIEIYSQQMRRYEEAVKELLGQIPTARICLLDDHKRVNIVEIN